MKRTLILFFALSLLSACFSDNRIVETPEDGQNTEQVSENNNDDAKLPKKERDPSVDSSDEEADEIRDQERSPSGRAIVRDSEEFGGFGLSNDLETDTSIHSVDLDDVLSGSQPKDGIPALYDPEFETQDQAREWLDDEGLGILYQDETEARFYPYAILYFHEIVNDEVNNTPIAVTFCPLCGSALVFERTIDEKVERFGVSGKLWESNLLMYDLETESLWSQILGEAVVGEKTGALLTVLPADTLTFAEVKEYFPEAQILSRETGYDRSYGASPYGDYETNDSLYFPVKGLGSSEAKAFPKKKLFVVSTALPGKTLGFHRSDLLEEKEAEIKVDGETIEAKVLEDGTVQLRDVETDEFLPHFTTMWFSLFAHLGEEEAVVWSK